VVKVKIFDFVMSKHSSSKNELNDLHLVISKFNYNELIAGRRQREHRDFKKHWKTRVENWGSKIIEFHCGYGKKAPAARVLCKRWIVRNGEYIFYLGKILEKTHCHNFVERKEGVLNSVNVVSSPENHQFDYKFQSQSKLQTAKKREAVLLEKYSLWLKKKNRKLSAAKYSRLQCDGYEQGRNNLIEAKSSTRREHIRMAVGQLLDYAFQGEKKFGRPKMAILLPQKPDNYHEITSWLKTLKISVVWKVRNGFADNANGRFS
jgi:hypothetical protein